MLCSIKEFSFSLWRPAWGKNGVFTFSDHVARSVLLTLFNALLLKHWGDGGGSGPIAASDLVVLCDGATVTARRPRRTLCGIKRETRRAFVCHPLGEGGRRLGNAVEGGGKSANQTTSCPVSRDNAAVEINPICFHQPATRLLVIWMDTELMSNSSRVSNTPTAATVGRAAAFRPAAGHRVN